MNVVIYFSQIFSAKDFENRGILCLDRSLGSTCYFAICDIFCCEESYVIEIFTTIHPEKAIYLFQSKAQTSASDCFILERPQHHQS
jgi:hypothetical protein